MARAIEGTFDISDKGIKPISATPRSIEILTLLNLLLTEAATGADPEAIIRKLERASPELADAARYAVRRGGVPSLLLMLTLLVNTCTSHVNVKIDAHLDINTLIDQARVYVTGGQPYEIQGPKVEPESTPQQPPGMNRQQKRLQERQSKKRQQQSSPQPPKEPKKHR